MKKMKLVTERAPLTVYRQRSIIDTNHAIDRGYDQRGVDKEVYPQFFMFKNRVIKAIKDGIDQILDTYKDYSNTYLIHSKSTGIGVVIKWRRQGDSKYDDGNNHAIVVSILPVKSKHYPKYAGDTLLFVELASFLQHYHGKKFQEQNLRENEYVKVPTDFGFDVILFEDKIWDIDAAYVNVE